jgi:hypothetical protein
METINIDNQLIDNQLININKLAGVLNAFVNENINKELKTILRKWKEYTISFYSLQLYSELKKIEIYKETTPNGGNIIYFLKPGEEKFYYISYHDEHNENYETNILLNEIPLKIKISILNNFDVVFDEYETSLNITIDKIKAEKEKIKI